MAAIPGTRPGVPGSGADVLIIGGGAVGLCCALAVASRGATVLVVGARRAGEASPAAAGLLAPAVERTHGRAHAFFVAGRDRYPDFIEELEERSGIRTPLNRDGILEVTLVGSSLPERVPPGAEWLDATALRSLEPVVPGAEGAVYHPHDGFVDNVVLLDALRRALAREPSVAFVAEDVEAIELDTASPAVVTASGARHVGARIVLAAGAWCHLIRGVPRALPVEPVRGQMLAFAGALIRHAVYAACGYLVPRGAETLVGATMEWVGFDSATTDDARAELRRVAGAIAPTLAHSAPIRQWAGLRPVTPDLLPILGVDPQRSALVYACGHSRNGILLAPVTGECVAALALGEAAPYDLTAFAVTRFHEDQ